MDDLENAVNVVINNQKILKQTEEKLTSGFNLAELCYRLKSVCHYIVAINYNKDENPEDFFVERTIDGMDLSKVVDKSFPINNIFWKIDEDYIVAGITTSSHATNVRFPFNHDKFNKFIHVYMNKAWEIRRTEQEKIENKMKEKDLFISWVDTWKKRNPDLIQFAKDNV